MKKLFVRKHLPTTRTSISLPPGVLVWGLEQMREEQFNSFSEYVQDLIRQHHRIAIVKTVKP